MTGCDEADERAARVLSPDAAVAAFKTVMESEREDPAVLQALAMIGQRCDGTIGVVLARLKRKDRFIPSNPHPVRELVLMAAGFGARHWNPEDGKLYFVRLCPEHLSLFGMTCRELVYGLRASFEAGA